MVSIALRDNFTLDSLHFIVRKYLSAVWYLRRVTFGSQKVETDVRHIKRLGRKRIMTADDYCCFRVQHFHHLQIRIFISFYSQHIEHRKQSITFQTKERASSRAW